jgi:aconitase A
LIIARSFARIHETNLKVCSLLAFSLLCPSFNLHDLPFLNDSQFHQPSPLFSSPLLLDDTSYRRAILTIQKQGILPLWFANKSDYSKISAHDQIETIGLKSLLSGENIGESGIRLKVTKPSGEVVEIETKHTMSPDQVEWLRAGSALNYIGEQARRA